MVLVSAVINCSSNSSYPRAVRNQSFRKGTSVSSSLSNKHTSFHGSKKRSIEWVQERCLCSSWRTVWTNGEAQYINSIMNSLLTKAYHITNEQRVLKEGASSHHTVLSYCLPDQWQQPHQIQTLRKADRELCKQQSCNNKKKQHFTYKDTQRERVQSHQFRNYLST